MTMSRTAVVGSLVGLFLTSPIPGDVSSAQVPVLPPALTASGVTAEADVALLNPSRSRLEHIANMYRLHSAALVARAGNDLETYERLMSEAVSELSGSSDMVQDVRFQHLFRTVVSEYERHFGPIDTLAIQEGSIFEIRDKVFDAIESQRTPLLAEVELPTEHVLKAEVPMPINEQVRLSMAFLLRNPETNLAEWIGRAETYFPMIEQVFADEGIPDELKYLAMIESGLDPRATSWANAVGLWQFVSTTAEEYGLTINSWVDERMDPEKSTRAAARHLRDLHEMFNGDWLLAMAGYNFNPRRLQQIVRAARVRERRQVTFWDVYDEIPHETRNYVPLYIATALLVSQTDVFGTPWHEAAPTYSYHYVPIEGGLTLAEIAAMSGTDVSTLRALNPELRRLRVPPTSAPYYLRLPLGTYARFEKAYSALPLERLGPSSGHTVKQNESLSDIARAYGIKITALMQRNDLTSTEIEAGDFLLVPLPDYGVPQQVGSHRQAVAVYYGSRKAAPLATGLELAEKSAAPAVFASSKTPTNPDAGVRKVRVVHRVKRGETMDDVSARYGVSKDDIARWNELRGQRLVPGTTLIMFLSRPADVTPPTTHTVRPGDSLSWLAKRYGVSIEQLRAWNDLTGSTLKSGQVLRVAESVEPVSDQSDSTH